MLNAKLKPYAPYIGIILVLGILLMYSQMRQRKYEAKIDKVFEFESTEVTEFTVSKDDVKVTVAKGDSSWFFVAPDTGRADDYRIKQFIREVLGATREGSISQDTIQYTQYGVTEGTAVVLEVRANGKTLSKVYLGQDKKDYTQEYVRYAGDDHVYSLRGRVIGNLSAAASWWR
mgnify:CR=1 FL=1